MDFLNAIIVGIVEGVTEFLPISSTGHLIVVNRFINFTGPFAAQFDVVILLGAILSVVVYFRKRLWPFSPGTEAAARALILQAWRKTIAGVFPALLIGGAMGQTIEKKLFNPAVVTAALLAGGIILLWIESRKKQRASPLFPASATARPLPSDLSSVLP